MDRHLLMGVPHGWPLRMAAISVLVLVVLAAHLQVSFATGIHFDLNEPAPIDPDDEAAQVEMEFEPPAHLLTATTTTTPAPSGRFKSLGKHRKCASEGHGGLSGWAKRIASRLPNYFDFGWFKGKFKRAYKASETHLRESVFVKKCLEVFKSRVSYRKGSSSYLKTINKFSDKTPEEFSQIYMVAPPIENYQNVEPEQQQQRQQQLDIKDYLKSVEQRKKQLERERQLAVGSMELESQSSLDNLGCSLDGAGSTFGGQLMERAQKEIDLLLSRSLYELEDEQLASAIFDELNDAAIEKVSQSAAADHIDQASSLHLPWPGMSASGGHNNDQPMIEKQLDWSQHECFHSVYDQGTECGKCYVMATTSLAEFYKCTELGPSKPVKKRQFSKDYVLNCAPKYSPTIMGCAGGSMLNTLRFMALAGVHNIRGWLQFRQASLRSINKHTPLNQNHSFSCDDPKCPLDQYQTPFERWGRIKVELNPRVLQRPADKEGRQLVWLEALQDGPLVVSVQMPSEGVDSYAEGIHDGAGCATSGHWHAMILVGYGHDDTGKSYWRFRNSFGPDWGMQGHFHLSADVPEACFGAAVRVYREPLSVADEKESPK